jgi:hypothetical protein
LLVAGSIRTAMTQRPNSTKGGIMMKRISIVSSATWEKTGHNVVVSGPPFECGASTNSAKGAHHGDQSNIIQEGAGQADRLDRLQSGRIRTNTRIVKKCPQW